MSGNQDFIRALAYFLAEQTEQSAGHLEYLIESFMRGAQVRSKLDRSATEDVKQRLKAEMEADLACER